MAKNGKKVTKAKRATKGEAPPPAPIPNTPTLKMEAGYGLDASIDDGYLRLSQADHEGNVETLMLSRSEAIVLFEQFREWATP